MVDLVEAKNTALQNIEGGKKVEQYLTFLMDKDEYGIDILAVQEIHGWVEPRPIPNTPEFIRGVIDWRGTVVPIVDLRVRFGYENATYDKTTVVIILKAEVEEVENEVIVGIVVDAVSDVHDISAENFRAAPSFGSKVDTRYINAMAKIGEAMIILLDLSKLINLNDLDGN